MWISVILILHFFTLFSDNANGGVIMKLINSQYRIAKLIEEDKYGVKYLVQDIHRDYMLKKMRLVEGDPDTIPFIEYR